MREVFSQLTFAQRNNQGIDEAAATVQLIAQSGGFDEPVLSAFLTHIQASEENQQKIKGAVSLAKSVGDGFNTEVFFSETSDPVLQRDVLAYTLAATQRFFQENPVVRELKETTFSAGYSEEILEIAEKMGMRDVQYINREKASVSTIPVHYGLCIGATRGAAVDYLERHKIIRANRLNYDQPYTLFMLDGDRRLIVNGKPSEPMEYLTELAQFSGVEVNALTEGHMMKERYHAIMGKTVEAAEAAGELVVIPAKTAEEFMGSVVTRLQQAPAGTNAVLTTYNTFARTYETMFNSALEREGISSVHLQSDAEMSGSSKTPAALLKELAKIINGRYQQAARNLGFEPFPQEQLLGGVIKGVEARAREAKSVVSPEGINHNGPGEVKKIAGIEKTSTVAL